MIDEEYNFESLGHRAVRAAHDLNNQLTSIIGRIELLKQNRQTNPSALQKQIDALERSARTSQRILERLAWQRSDHFSEYQTDPQRIFSAWKNDFEQDEKIKFTFEQFGHAHAIAIEQATLDSAVKNLIENAKFALKEVTAPWISIEGHGLGTHYEILIKDNGVGIQDVIAQKIFTPFFTTKKERGSGLGLSNARSDLRGVGANLEFVGNTPGACFKIYIPYATLRGVEQTKDQIQEHKKLSILVTEDDEGVREVLCDMLRHTGHQVVACASPADAESAANKYSFDIALIDLELKNESGLQLADALKKINPDIPVLMMTGWTSMHHQLETQTLINGFIQKPFRLEELEAALTRLTC